VLAHIHEILHLFPLHAALQLALLRRRQTVVGRSAGWFLNLASMGGAARVTARTLPFRS